ncbi:MAG: hypothetical protein P8Z38_09590 [Robiginitalea sp.]
MKSVKIQFLVFSVLIPCFFFMANAQEGEGQSLEAEHTRKHSLSVLLAHVHIGDGAENGSIRGIQRPSWMIAYNYRFNENWAVGLHGDIILETFSVETGTRSEGGSDELLEREYPISLVGAGTYKPIEHLGIILGGGLEFDKSEAFGLIRFGLEPNLRLSNRVELILNLSYDIKIDAYDNWNLGFGIAYGL